MVLKAFVIVAGIFSRGTFSSERFRRVIFRFRRVGTSNMRLKTTRRRAFKCARKSPYRVRDEGRSNRHRRV